MGLDAESWDNNFKDCAVVTETKKKFLMMPPTYLHHSRTQRVGLVRQLALSLGRFNWANVPEIVENI